MVSSTLNAESSVLYDEQWNLLKDWIKASGFSKVVFFCDDHTRGLCLPYVIDKLGSEGKFVFEMPSGEQFKTMETALKFWAYAAEIGLDRDSLLIGLGGGVVTDLAGFVSSIWKRGISIVQIPTTLMAMADASIGAKTGVDFLGVKNLLGSFHPPSYILVDTFFLETLPARQYHNGSVELIKHYLLRYGSGIETFVGSLRAGNAQGLSILVRDAIQFKLDVVSRDPFDKGERKILNLGHTMGHALESWGLARGYDILHGEAVALGIWIEMLLAEKLYHWDQNLTESIGSYLAMYFPEHYPRGGEWHELLQYLANDKKREAGMMRFSLLEKPGRPVWDIPVERPLLEKILSNPRFPANFAVE